MTQELRKLAEAATQTTSMRVNAAYCTAANPAAILELLDRLDAAEKDAERYRWLREQYWTKGGLVVTEVKNVRLGAMCPTEKNLDETIDRAMEASK